MNYRNIRNGTNSQVQKALNKAMVLHVLSVSGPLSRQDIASEVNLTSGAVTNIISSLNEEGIIKEASFEDYEEYNKLGNGPGRRPVPIEINAEAKRAIGISLTEHSFTFGLFNLKGDLIFSPEINFEQEFTPRNISQYISGLVEQIEKNYIEGDQLLGICTVVPGLIDSAQGVVKNSPRLGWKNINLGEMLEEMTDLPVIIETSMRGWTAQELCFNYIDTNESFISIYAGIGIGAGIVVDGKILQGSNFGAGEFGHMVIEPHGPACSCGSRGCLEALAAIEPFMKNVLERVDIGEIEGDFDYYKPSHYDLFQKVIELVDNNDQIVLEVVDETAEYLGIGIANVINLLNPDYIVVTGMLFDIPVMQEKVEEYVDRYTFRSPEEKLTMLKKETDVLSWSRGAAAVVFNRLFFNPKAHI